MSSLRKPGRQRCADETDKQRGAQASRWLGAAGTVLLVELLAGTLTLIEAGQASGGHEINFNHLGGTDTAYTLYNLENGEQFTLNIMNTCDEAFSYEIRGVSSPGSTRVRKAANLRALWRNNRRSPALIRKTLPPVVHSTAHGGYIVNITKLLPDPRIPCTGGQTLESITLTIFTPEGNDDWAIGFSSGFTVSGLTDPDVPKEDARLGIAAFVHMYHQHWKLPWLAPMFALGLRDERSEYYFGLGARLGDKATLNAGYVFGPRSESSPVQTSWFFGISYSFLSFGEDLIGRPFAGAGDGG